MQLESLIQSSFIQWLEYHQQHLLPHTVYFHIPNGEHAGKDTIARIKAGRLAKHLGTHRGVADMLFCYTLEHISHNLWLEFKTLQKSSRQSIHQREFQQQITQLPNNHYEIARTLEEAIDILQHYQILSISHIGETL